MRDISICLSYTNKSEEIAQCMNKYFSLTRSDGFDYVCVKHV